MSVVSRSVRRLLAERNIDAVEMGGFSERFTKPEYERAASRENLMESMAQNAALRQYAAEKAARSVTELYSG